MTMLSSKQLSLKQAPRSIHSKAKRSSSTEQNKMLQRKSCSSTSSCSSSSDRVEKPQRPSLYIQSLFVEVGACAKTVTSSMESFSKPTDDDMASYDLQTVRAIRTQNLPELRRLHAEGKSLNACNQFGESLIHMACRRGNVDIVTFMIHEANVRVDIRDDFGRNPLHDACWTTTPNFDVMDVLLEVANPNMLVTEDVRGSAPFDYARREHYKKWLGYLESRKELILRRIQLSQALAPMTAESVSISG